MNIQTLVKWIAVWIGSTFIFQGIRTGVARSNGMVTLTQLWNDFVIDVWPMWAGAAVVFLYIIGKIIGIAWVKAEKAIPADIRKLDERLKAIESKFF